MSTYATLRQSVLDLMQQTIQLVDPFPGQSVSADAKAQVVDRLILSAANNARKHAEKVNMDWVYNESSSNVTLAAGGNRSLVGHTDNVVGDTFDYKLLYEVQHKGVPIFTNTQRADMRRRFLRRRSPKHRVYGLLRNNSFYLHPPLTESVDLEFFGIRWMRNYNAATKPGMLLTDPIVTEQFASELDAPVQGKPAYASSGQDATNPPADPDAYPWFSIYWAVDGEESFWVIDHYESVEGGFTTYYSEEDVATPDLVTQWNDNLGPIDTITVVPSTQSVPIDSATNTDWMLQYGFDYLQWATVCELNYLLEVYTPRTEGSLPPPVRERDTALDALIRWDTDMRDAMLNYKDR